MDYQGYYSFDAADVAMARGPVLDLVRRALDYLAEREPKALIGIESQVREAIAGREDPRSS